AAPVSGLALAHGVPSGLVLPVVMAAADREPGLAPDDLGPHLEAACLDRVGYLRCEPAGVPDVRHVPGEQRVRLPPVHAVVVADLAHAVRVVDARLLAPLGVVANAIWWIGHHEHG